jgi:hypothetical protein
MFVSSRLRRGFVKDSNEASNHFYRIFVVLFSENFMQTAGFEEIIEMGLTGFDRMCEPVHQHASS